jgi:hypothetical protein
MTSKIRTRVVTAVAMMAGTLFFAVAGGGCDLLKGKEKKPFGEECKIDTDCESLKCQTFGSICTKTCGLDSECGGDLVCRDDDQGAGHFCAKPVGQAPNGVCNNAPDCQHGHCLKRVGQQDQPGICSKLCATPADCPAGMKICDAISDSGAIKFCLPGDEATPPAARPVFAPQPKKVVTDAGAAKVDAGGSPLAPLTPVDAGAAATDAGTPADAGAAADAGADAGKPAADGGLVKLDGGRPIIKIQPKK